MGNAPKTLKTPDTERGYYKKFVVTHADGTPVDPNADYFVLRLDGDTLWSKACREALALLANRVKYTYPVLARDLQLRYGESESEGHEGQDPALTPVPDTFDSDPEDWELLTLEQANSKVKELMSGVESGMSVVQREALVANYLARNAQEGVVFLLKKLKTHLDKTGCNIFDLFES